MSLIMVKSNLYTNVDHDKFIDSTKGLDKDCNDNVGYVFARNFSLGSKDFRINEVKALRRPISILDNHIVCDSLIVNKDELIKELYNKEISVKDNDEGQMLLKLLINQGVDSFNKINGAFALVYTNKDKLIAARDPFGIRSLYYSMYNNDIIIASSVKQILKYKEEAVVNLEGVKELLGMGPSNTLGKTIFKDIYELKPGHYLTFDKQGLNIVKYYNLESKRLNLSLCETKEKVEEILKDSINLLSKDILEPCSLLSGGLDSSIVSLYLNETKDNLKTYSMDYEQDKKDYKVNKFETSNDQDFIPIVLKKGNFNHDNCKVSVKDLVDTLEEVALLNDAPGMADIDGALLWLCKNTHESNQVIFSGEGSDEIFAGYPWFYREDGSQTGFPWLRNLEFRQSLLKEDLKKKINLVEYVTNAYEDIVNDTPVNKDETKLEIKQKQTSYVTLNYFMKTLLRRSEVMSKGANKEIRMPFSDKRLVELLYNTPFEYKYEKGKEKALLRNACINILPKEIYERTKSPFPKVRNEEYEKEVTKLLKQSMEDSNSYLHKIFDIDMINELINDDNELSLPWFGQLMRKPQLIAYLYQIDYLFKTYNVKLEI